jgi:hypothetical protein
MFRRSLAALADALARQLSGASSRQAASRVARALPLTAIGVLALLSVAPAHAGTKPTPAQKG